MKVEVSNGELLDKISILEIKSEQIKNPDQLKNIKKELEMLKSLAQKLLADHHNDYHNLKNVNQELWEIEDQIRILEKNKDFGPAFIETARSVYLKNDLRARIKKEINIQSNSHFQEEKSYEDY